ncbi:unnamed protein product [Cyclocybe aegerita]|uniref:Ribosomal protein S2 n=1 Tax=Cyclocybe aegerita TaxID=1973307 RepID=A0A8S0VS02_CYCAE|nr:unnamed protein product [Cyclocybe aegerita]
MSQPALRTWLASARCTSKSATASASSSRIFTRYQSTEELLKTPEDWARFKQKRQETKDIIEIFSQYGSTVNPDNTFRLRHGIHKPIAHATTSALLAAGAHFGHASTRMNPNFVPYAYGTRAGITIIDLDHTVPMLRRAANLTRQVARDGGIILFIGTRPDLRPVVYKASERLGKQGFHVGDRWLPGTLSNRRQFFGESEVDSHRTTPDLAIILNPLQNTIAIQECAQAHVPTIGIIDSNVDPRLVMYPIPANDENPRTAELVAGILSIAGGEGVTLREKARIEGLKKKEKWTRQKRSKALYENNA